MQVSGGPLWILAEEEMPCHLLAGSFSSLIFSLGTYSWGWIFVVCCYQAVHDSHSQAVPAPTSQRLPGPCVGP